MKKSILLLMACAMLLNLKAQVSVEVSFVHEGLQLNGTLTKPSSVGVFPLIIICPGSGANDRNATLPLLGATVQCFYPAIYGDTLRPYKDLAEALTAKGYAVLRYDKIEYTYPNPGTITFRKLWLPVMSAVDYAKTRNDIDASKIILAGHSESGMLIPYISKQRNDIFALINLAGARTSFDSLLAYQYRTFPRMCNSDTTQTDLIASQTLAYFQLIRSGTWNGSTPPFAGVPAAVWAEYTRIGDSVVHNYNLSLKPLLFIGLEKDINVPVTTEYERFKKEITTPATFVRLPDIIHYMNPFNNKRISPSIPDTIAWWLQSKGVSATGNLLNLVKKLKVLYKDNQIELNVQNETITEVAVYDMAGSCVLRFAKGQTSFSAETLRKGMYILKVNSGMLVYTEKLLVR